MHIYQPYKKHSQEIYQNWPPMFTTNWYLLSKNWLATLLSGSQPIQEESMRQSESSRSIHQPLPLFTAPIHALIHLDRSSNIPLYRQICQGLREAILSGQLAEGTRLPTERALASELGVNRTTVMNAYNEIASEGLIEGHVGRGTLVKRGDIRNEDDFPEQELSSWMFGLVAGEE